MSEQQLRAIVDDLVARKDLRPGSDEQKIRDLYLSVVDTTTRDAAGIEPLRPVLERIAGIDSPGALAAAFGRVGEDGTRTPIRAEVIPGRKDPGRHELEIDIDGLGMPDIDGYFGLDDHALDTRLAYVEHIGRMLGFAGIPPAEIDARIEAVWSLERDLAEVHAKHTDTDAPDWALSLIHIS